MRNLPVKTDGRHYSSTILDQIIDEIKKRGDPKALAGMARFGIQTSKAFGVSIPQLRDLARKIGKNHYLAEQLWRTGIHEARILAGMTDDPARVTEDQMEKWALRQIGKRNAALNAAALKICAEIVDSGSKSGKWIAADALRELTSPRVKKKFANMKPLGSEG